MATGLNATFRQRLESLIAAAPAAVNIVSGFRSVERQRQLFNAAVQRYGSPAAARRWVAPPGKSNHNRGTAADLSFADGRTRAWVHANASRFGLFFPMGHEPWHIEPIGIGGFEPEALTEAPATPRDPVDALLSRLGQTLSVTPNPASPQLSIPTQEVDSLMPDLSVLEAPAPGDVPVSVPDQPAAVPGGSSPGIKALAGRSVGADFIARAAHNAGFRGDALVTAIAVALAESSGNPSAVGDVKLQNKKWGPSVGLWQVRSLNDQRGSGSPRDQSRLKDPMFNARSAFAISGGGSDFSPWTMFKRGTYRKFLGAARGAVTNLGAVAA